MIIAIVGPTGVGKTSLSVALAKRINAEIINCDSMQVYKELNIGVAKIREEEKEGVVHHLFSIVSVKDDFSVYNYQQMGRALIDKLLSENKNIIIVGGTGLYLKALLYDYTFDDNKNSNTPLYPFKLIGLTRPREHLYSIINKRVDMMFDMGLLEEVKSLYDSLVNTRAINTAIGYKELIEYFKGDITLEEAKDKIKQSSRRYAKRQYTFFNNQFPNIKWIDVEDVSLESIIDDILK